MEFMFPKKMRKWAKNIVERGIKFMLPFLNFYDFNGDYV
jgi:hypothetical protein